PPGTTTRSRRCRPGSCCNWPRRPQASVRRRVKGLRITNLSGRATASAPGRLDVLIMTAAPDSTLLAALRERVVVADGAMGTMLQAHDLTLDDFEGLEGCNEILNVTRPDVVRDIHDAYLAVGCDAVETNTFGANFANLAEYGIADRITELAEAGARLAREVADGYSTP